MEEHLHCGGMKLRARAYARWSKQACGLRGFMIFAVCAAVLYTGISLSSSQYSSAHFAKQRAEFSKQISKLPQFKCASLAGNVCNYSPEANITLNGYYHITAYGDWEEIVSEQLQMLRTTCLWKHGTLHVGLLSTTITTSLARLWKIARGAGFDASTMKISRVSDDTELYEPFTLDALHQDCKRNNSPSRVLNYYLHSKGVGYRGWGLLAWLRRYSKYRSFQAWFHVAEYVEDWKDFLGFFMFENPKACIEALSGSHIACGLNTHETGYASQFKDKTDRVERVPALFNGNYWWARCDYVATLDRPAQECKKCGEFWVLSGTKGGANDARIAKLFHSETNHYESPFPRSSYDSVFQDKSC